MKGACPIEQEKRDSVKSLGKALHLIDIINQARTPMTLMSLSQVSGFPKSTVYALLSTLRSYDCIRQGSDGRYYLGTRLFEWGCGVSASWELNNVARPYLEKLAAHTDATALLSRIEGNSVVVIDQSTAMCGGIYVTTEIGTHLPLHATSQGKLLLAAMSDASAKAFLSGAGSWSPSRPTPSWSRRASCGSWGKFAPTATPWKTANTRSVCGRSPRRFTTAAAS